MAHTQFPYMCTCEQKAQISRLCVMHAAMRLSLGRTTATVMVVRPSRLARDLDRVKGSVIRFQNMHASTSWPSVSRFALCGSIKCVLLVARALV